VVDKCKYILPFNGGRIQLIMRCFKTPYLGGMPILAEVILKKKVERDRKLCKLCQIQEIGYKFHYIIECPFFKCKIKLLIKQEYIQNPNMIKLKNLMTSKNRKELTNMCKLVREINKGVCAPC
jgi:hypothetical protein